MREVHPSRDMRVQKRASGLASRRNIIVAVLRFPARGLSRRLHIMSVRDKVICRQPNSHLFRCCAYLIVMAARYVSRLLPVLNRARAFAKREREPVAISEFAYNFMGYHGDPSFQPYHYTILSYESKGVFVNETVVWSRKIIGKGGCAPSSIAC
jgi:hypothetical protein